MFHNVNLSHLENVLQRNLRTDRTRECIFRASGGPDFPKDCNTRMVQNYDNKVQTSNTYCFLFSWYYVCIMLLI